MPLLIDQVRPLLTASLSFSLPQAKDWSSGGLRLFVWLDKPSVEVFSGAATPHLRKLLILVGHGGIAGSKPALQATRGPPEHPLLVPAEDAGPSPAFGLTTAR